MGKKCILLAKTRCFFCLDAYTFEQIMVNVAQSVERQVVVLVVVGSIPTVHPIQMGIL